MRCDKCGFRYIPEIEENVKQHNMYHDKIVHGIRAARIKSDKTIFEDEINRITVVNCFSPIQQKKRAQMIGEISRHDTGFDFIPYDYREPVDKRDTHIFLLYRKNRGIGFLLTEQSNLSVEYTWPEYENEIHKDFKQIKNQIWTIGLIWVHNKYRKSGLAFKLLENAAKFFNTAPNKLGWYTPFTETGKPFAKKICPHSFIIGKSDFQ